MKLLLEFPKGWGVQTKNGVWVFSGTTVHIINRLLCIESILDDDLDIEVRTFKYIIITIFIRIFSSSLASTCVVFAHNIC